MSIRRLTIKMIQIDAIERYVDQVLEINGFCKGDKELLRQLLHRLYTAATMFHLMTDEQRALIGRIQTELSAFFVTKIVLKERKRKGRKRKIPPTPPNKVKEGQVKDQKNPPTAARREAFHQECLKYVDKFNNQRLADFFNYWSEEDGPNGKMRFEKERTWNTGKRLYKWANSEVSCNTKVARFRLAKTKQGRTPQSTAADQAAAKEREAMEAKWEIEREETKKNAISYEEYLARKNQENA